MHTTGRHMRNVMEISNPNELETTAWNNSHLIVDDEGHPETTFNSW